MHYKKKKSVNAADGIFPTSGSGLLNISQHPIAHISPLPHCLQRLDHSLPPPPSACLVFLEAGFPWGWGMVGRGLPSSFLPGSYLRGLSSYFSNSKGRLNSLTVILNLSRRVYRVSVSSLRFQAWRRIFCRAIFTSVPTPGRRTFRGGDYFPICISGHPCPA